jgi:hypothetical protein
MIVAAFGSAGRISANHHEKKKSFPKGAPQTSKTSLRRRTRKYWRTPEKTPPSRYSTALDHCIRNRALADGNFHLFIKLQGRSLKSFTQLGPVSNRAVRGRICHREASYE